jgi:tripartite-type tricarboxylate transporter receptor subunit TctC
MVMSRRAASTALVSLGLVPAAFVQGARAQAYPSKPIRLVVPTGAGGITDIVARVIGQRLSERLNQPVIIDNKPGASGIIGTEVVAKAAPDGHTMLIVFPSYPVNPALKKTLPYDSTKDFTGISTLTTVSLVLLVPPELPVNNVQELIALAKKQKLNCANVSAGSLAHLGAELFRAKTGIELVHVPYRSSPDAQRAVMAGEVQMFFDTPITAVPQVKAGKLKALGVSTKARSPLMPDVPTIAEAGVPGFEVLGWNAFMVPSGTPAPIVERLNKEVQATLAEPEILKKLAEQGADPWPQDVAAVNKLMKDDIAKWTEVIRNAGIQPE